MSDIATNSKARHEFEVLETFEAGIVLKGTEVKSLRQGQAQINDAFARVEGGEVFLYNAHIPEYTHGNIQNHRPDAPRKLLLRRREIARLAGLIAQKGLTLVPLSLYWKGHLAKVRLALVKPKARYDKRRAIKEREEKQKIRRTLMHRFKRENLSN